MLKCKSYITLIINTEKSVLKKLLVIFSILLISACSKSSDNDSSTNSASTDSSAETTSSSSSSGYDKIEWQTMDANQDGYVSPEEMVDHYNSTGVYN